MRILIGFDGSEASHAAVTDLRRAGLPGQAEALVLTAAEYTTVMPAVGFVPPSNGGLVMPVSGEEIHRLVEREQRRAAAVAETGAKLLAELFPAWRVQTETADSPAHAALVEAAERWRADLVVVGSHAQSAVGRLVFGSVAQSTLAHAPCGVRIGRGGAPDSEKPLGFPLRLLAAVDGSPDSGAAVDAVCRRTWPTGTEVRLAVVAETRLLMTLIRSHLTPEESAGETTARSPVERLVRSAEKQFCGAGIGVSTVVLEGDPKRALLREADRWSADCVFLGARGHSRFEQFLIGSVSATVAARAGCSVEVVRPRTKE